MLRKRLNELPVEELANTLTHGAGLVLSVVGVFVLATLAVLRGDPLYILASIVYGSSLVTLYAASTMYHGTTSPKRKKVLQIVDHCCIYLLIAGSYTPFGLVILDGQLGQALLCGIWAFAAVGIALKLIFGDKYPAISVTSYVIMGWMGAFAIQPLLESLGTMPVALAVAGGVAYTLGVVFFPWKSIRHHHAIFHVFVLAGSIFHHPAVVLYVIPLART